MLDQEAMLAAKGEEPVEQQGFGFPLHKPTTELAQHGGVEARIGQGEAKQVFLVDPAANGVGGPSVRQVFRELQHRRESQAP